jgi:2-aminoethylphosphonate-pyruvate transaminase
MLQEIRLLTPGPLALAPEVKAAMLTDLGSRDYAFREVTRDIRRMILALSGADRHHSVIPVQGSGTFAIEAVITTFIKPTDKVLVCVNGIYGELAAKILSCHGLRHATLTRPITEAISAADVEHHLSSDPSFTHLYFAHCETTSGVLNPLPELVELARRHGMVSIIDAMSSFGAVDIDARRTPFDILVSSGNKCLEAPPGIAFAVVRKSLLTSDNTVSRTYVLDLLDQWRMFELTGEWRSTPPTHVAQALRASLMALTEESVAGRRVRYSGICARLVTGLRSLQIYPILPPELQSPICLAVRSRHIPNAQIFAQYYQHLRAAGLLIYARFHEETRSFRIGCIGQIQPEWVDDFIRATARFVRSNGHPPETWSRDAKPLVVARESSR